MLPSNGGGLDISIPRSLSSVLDGSVRSVRYINGKYFFDIFRGADKSPTNACMAIRII